MKSPDAIYVCVTCLVTYVLVIVFALSMCKMASRSDELMDKAMRERDKEK